VSGDKIIFAGSQLEAEKFRNDKTKSIDLQGKTMTPGFIEGHGHLFGLGFNELTLNLADIKSFDELVNKVRRLWQKPNQATGLSAGVGTRINGRRREENDQGIQTHEALSAVSPDNPVFRPTPAATHHSLTRKPCKWRGVNQLSKSKCDKPLPRAEKIIRDPLGNRQEYL